MPNKTKSPDKWPKTFPPLTPGQAAISDDFMQYWHQVLPRRYGVVDEFNHNYVVKTASKNFTRTLEIGAVVGDCQQRMDFEEGYFDRILAIHVLEHLPNLPAAVREMHRLCDKSLGSTIR